MNWKMTAVFGVLLAVALGIYLFRGTDPVSGTTGPQGNRLFPDLVADRLVRIEILRRGETATRIERATDSVGDYWRIAPPVDKPADISLVREMMACVDRFVRTGGLEPGIPETAPTLTGLDEPRLVVTLEGPGSKETVRFGKQPPTNSTAVFFQKEGDPKIYLAAQEVLDAFDKPALSLRQKQLARFDPYRVVKVEVEHKFTRVRQGEPSATEYERSTLERLEGSDKGWWLTQPHQERLDDLKVMALIMELAAMPIEDWRPVGNLKAQGFDEPWDRISIWRFGSDQPIRVLFGDVDGTRTKRFAHVEGSNEVARVEVLKYDRLPLQRNHFRPIIVFPFSRDAVQSFRLEVRDLGRVVIERREAKNPETGLVTASWELVEPDPKKDFKIEKEKLENFVGTVLGLRIEKDGFWGEQDFKTANLDPAEMTLTLKTKDGKTHLSHYSLNSAAAFMRREGVKEVFSVHRETVGLMRRLELNFLHPEIFNVSRESLREFTFEARTGELERIYYTVRFNAEKGNWTFVKPKDLEGKEPNGNILSSLLAVMNYVQASTFLGREASIAKEHQLNDGTSPATLTVLYEGNPGKAVFYFSKNQSDKPTHPIYFARLEGNSVVFQINSPFVEGLKMLPQASREEKAPKPDGEKK